MIRTPQHVPVVLVCSGAMFISYVDRVNISVAALAMQAEFGWSDTLKGLILAAFFLGYMVMQIVGGWLAHRFGGRRVLLGALIAWSVFTLLTPVAAHLWLPMLFAIRIALGLGEGPLNPAVYAIFARDVPPLARARAVALYSSCGFLGTFFALASTGWFVEHHGWESVFYLFGALGLGYTFLILRVIAPDAEDRSVQGAPLDDEAAPAGSEPIPWRTLLTLGPFWALTFAFFCTSWIFYVLLLWMPSYFARMHGISMAGAGIYSLWPWIVMAVAINLAGWWSDSAQKRGMALTTIRKLLVCLGLFGAGALLMLLGFAGSPGAALACFCLTLTFLALAYSSHAANVFDLAPRYAHVLFSVMNTFGSLPGLIGVALTGLLVELTRSYDAAFALAGLFAWVGAGLYLRWGTARQLLS